MACFSPLQAWQLESGEVVFAERGKVLRALTLPCGQCIGCRLERSRQWAVRCVHESRMHEHSCFVTLTYNDDHVPERGQLTYRHFQLFVKRLRKEFGFCRFYMCGEYGPLNDRPHFHAVFFGVYFADRKLFKTSGSGFKVYTSPLLERLWPYGFSSVADFSFEAAAYVARYVCGKVTGDRAEKHYARVCVQTGEIFQKVPEFNRMSLKPGIGATWFDKYCSEVYPRDYVVIRGMKMKPPKYYDRLLAFEEVPNARGDFVTELVSFARDERATNCLDDTTPDRLKVREVVTRARLSFKRRQLE